MSSSHTPSSPTLLEVPVSVGELVDKITILEIKSERITDPDKNRNVRRELQALLAVCATHGVSVTDELFAELKKINETLWDIEDRIRDHERAKDFGPEFVKLARAVYVTNDERFRVKGLINARSGSAFHEEKSYKPYK